MILTILPRKPLLLLVPPRGAWPLPLASAQRYRPPVHAELPLRCWEALPSMLPRLTPRARRAILSIAHLASRKVIAFPLCELGGGQFQEGSAILRDRFNAHFTGSRLGLLNLQHKPLSRGR